MRIGQDVTIGRDNKTGASRTIIRLVCLILLLPMWQQATQPGRQIQRSGWLQKGRPGSLRRAQGIDIDHHRSLLFCNCGERWWRAGLSRGDTPPQAAQTQPSAPAQDSTREIYGRATGSHPRRRKQYTAPAQPSKATSTAAATASSGQPSSVPSAATSSVVSKGNP
jgi:hypothetical protein